MFLFDLCNTIITYHQPQIMDSLSSFIETTARDHIDELQKKALEQRMHKSFREAIRIKQQLMFPDDPSDTRYDHHDIKTYLALGWLISVFHEWSADSIVGTFVSSMEDANFGDFGSKVQEDFEQYLVKLDWENG